MKKQKLKRRYIKCNQCKKTFIDIKDGFGRSPKSRADRWFCWVCWDYIEQESAIYGYYDYD